MSKLPDWIENIFGQADIRITGIAPGICNATIKAVYERIAADVFARTW